MSAAGVCPGLRGEGTWQRLFLSLRVLGWVGGGLGLGFFLR